MVDAAAHCGTGGAAAWLDMTMWRDNYDEQRWREVLAATVQEEALGERLKEATRKGLPWGSKELRRGWR